MCNCNCSNNHRVVTVTYTGTAIELTATNTNDIASLESFNLICCKPVSSLVTGEPVPVSITINGVAGIPLRDDLGLPIMSNAVPRGKTCGTYVVNTTGETTDTYLMLRTPHYA